MKTGRSPVTHHPIRIAPSILAATLAKLGADVERAVEAGGDLIHFDVMDNVFVPNLTFGGPVLKSLRRHRRRMCT
jgi:ribulose-phosphate 3-epimerase